MSEVDWYQIVDRLVTSLTYIGDELRQLREQHAPTPEPPIVTVELPGRCAGIPESKCALQDEDAKRSVGGFANPDAWMCMACRHREGA
jgi:hypothetical protein